MSSRAEIQQFLEQKTLAVVGVSRDPKKFGYRVYNDLLRKGYRTFAVNPNSDRVDARPCYPTLRDLPEPVGGVVCVVPPKETEKVVREMAEVGISRVWMQQGSESEDAIRFCDEQEIGVVSGHCILMFAEPVESMHRLHHWLWKVFGKLPA